MLHPLEPRQVPYVTQCLGDGPTVTIAASDYLKALPDGVAKWIPGTLLDARARTASAAAPPARSCATSSRSTRSTSHSPRSRGSRVRKPCPNSAVARAMETLGINPDKPNPART